MQQKKTPRQPLSPQQVEQRTRKQWIKDSSKWEKINEQLARVEAPLLESSQEDCVVKSLFWLIREVQRLKRSDKEEVAKIQEQMEKRERELVRKEEDLRVT